MTMSPDRMTVDRAIRQRDLGPPQALSLYHVLIVGVGAIGRQVAVQLAAMGADALTLIDDDVVSIENLAVQGYPPDELGLAKVRATADACPRLLPEIVIDERATKFKRSSGPELPCLTKPARPRLAVFCCVDSMAGRRIVFEIVRQQASLFVDGRMAGETLRILASLDPAIDAYYPTTLFEDAQAHPAPCTGRSTLYAASIAAGWMLSRFALHLRNQVPGRDVLLQLTYLGIRAKPDDRFGWLIHRFVAFDGRLVRMVLPPSAQIYLWPVGRGPRPQDSVCCRGHRWGRIPVIALNLLNPQLICRYADLWTRSRPPVALNG